MLKGDVINLLQDALDLEQRGSGNYEELTTICGEDKSVCEDFQLAMRYKTKHIALLREVIRILQK
ncbi:MAG: hypothetical protein COT81_05635 [Candidatus Buchananbacteria bacterium CG10_big_fil_rev_8_21_14_0_10_42_9]|uniref:Uncharacterized protein n=1 Tax=Candidatus Buchananbacteria bacterium CG10_big_fil_rev_8_21_14_0_10_42_9 TaxID=1974526 RepID=A0A2H0VZS5_9BACT|nr:MAG: hypothetical protein COT81_05635 [Candidatus Buchananbacteria bacterium CG10_big_fil_rev_8_21_14_0_10_42_9]